MVTSHSTIQFYQQIAEEILRRIKKKTTASKTFRLALSGGSTPGPLYEFLSQSDVDWGLVELYLVDDRYVPFDDARSNKTLIDQSLISKLRTAPKAFVFFDTNLPIEQALQTYQRHLDPSQTAFFDLALLGLGSDGHTASLFPETNLSSLHHWVAHTTTEENEVRDRLTLTPKAINSSQEIFFLVKGSSKKAILDQLKSGAGDYPAAQFFHLEKTTVFFCES